MPKYQISVPAGLHLTVVAEGEDPDDAISNAEGPSVCAQCSGWGREDYSLDAGDPEWELAEALEVGEDGEVLESEWERSAAEALAKVEESTRANEQRDRDEAQAELWRQVLSLPWGVRSGLATGLRAAGHAGAAALVLPEETSREELLARARAEG